MNMQKFLIQKEKFGSFIKIKNIAKFNKNRLKIAKNLIKRHKKKRKINNLRFFVYLKISDSNHCS